jgi:hypothetical protein
MANVLDSSKWPAGIAGHFLCTTVVVNQGKLEQIRVHSWLIFL